MRKLFLLISFIFLYACSNEPRQDNFLHRSWMKNGELVIKNGNYYTYYFKNNGDKFTKNDTLIPIQELDSLILITRNLTIPLNIITQPSTDTFSYEIRNFHGTKLLLYRDRSDRPEVFNLQGSETLAEKLNFHDISFEMEGITIGDSISRENLSNAYRNTATPSTESAKYKGLSLSIIGNYYVYRIQRYGIPLTSVKNMKDVISKKLGVEPIISKGPNLMLNYRWEHNGINIRLFRQYVAGKYDERWWGMTYDDRVKQALLDTEFSNVEPLAAKSRLIN